MAKPLKSIQFPNSEEIYTITQLDKTLKESGQSADSKIVGDKFGKVANAYKKTVFGEFITINDASTLNHHVECAVSGIPDPSMIKINRCGQNLIPENPWPDIYKPDGDGGFTANYSRSLHFPINLPSGVYVLNVDVKCPTDGNYRFLIRYTSGQFVISYPMSDGTYKNQLLITKKEAGPIKEIVFEYGSTKADVHFKELSLTMGEIPTTEEYQGETFIPTIDGRVLNIESLGPNMTIFSDTPGVQLEVTYNVDTEKAFPNFPSNSDGSTNYGLPGQVAFSDGTGGIYWGNSKEKDSFANVANAVRAGLAPQMYPVGYEFTTRDESNNRDITWVVRGHNNFKKVDDETAPTMTLEMKNVWSNSGGTQISVQFDSPEAFYAVTDTELVAGTYNFTLLKGYDEAYGGGKTYSFTLTQNVPVGGQLIFPWGYNQQASSIKVSSYKSATDTDVIETVSVTESADGTALGEVDGKTKNMNHSHRIRYGSNNYAQSAYRQFLNSSAEAGSVWKPQTMFDRPPSWAASQAGLLKGLPKEFVDAVATVTVPCRTNDIAEINSSDGTVFTTHMPYDVQDKFFVLSLPEMYGITESGIADGKVLEYYDGLANAQRIKRDAAGTARYAWLRSPHPWSANFVRSVSTDGYYSNYIAHNSLGVAAACVIA